VREKYILIFLGVLVAVILAILLGARFAKHTTESMNCGNYMSSICFAGRIWAGDHDGHFPPNLLLMSNELNNPIIHGDHIGYSDGTVFDGIRRRTKIP
jgi:hypothetical protein